MSTMLSIDIYTPSLPSIQACFHTGADQVRVTVAMLSVGSCLSIPLYGPLSDAWGRRPILLIGQLIYLVGLLLAIFSGSIQEMIWARFIQGLGSSAAGCVGFALASDLSKGSKRISYFSYLSATVTLCLVVGPLIGGLFESYDYWRGSFVFLVGLTLLSIVSLYWLPETIKEKKPVQLMASLKSYGRMLKNPYFVGNSLIPPLMIGGIVAYVVNGVFYFVQELHLTPHEFSYHQAFVMFINTGGGVLAGSVVRSHGSKPMLKLGMTFLTLGTLGLWIVLLSSSLNPVLITTFMSFYAFGLGSTFGIYVNGAISLFPQNSGSVSSLLSMIRSVIISGAIMASNWLYDRTLSSIVIMITVAAFLAVLGTLLLQKPSSPAPSPSGARA
jgi:DHA1 family bicyclomycin/chloramphenicol resistance-like MFS transporter